MNTRLFVLFARSDVRVILVLITVLLLGAAITIYKKSRDTITPDVIIRQIDAAAEPESPNKRLDKEFYHELLERNPVDINTAPADSLELLPGIGPELSRRIIDFRQQFGSFQTVEDLVKIRGIGDTRLEEIRPMVTTGAQ